MFYICPEHGRKTDEYKYFSSIFSVGLSFIFFLRCFFFFFNRHFFPYYFNIWPPWPLCSPLQAVFRLLLLRWRRGTPPALRLSCRHHSPSHTTPPAAQYVQRQQCSGFHPWKRYNSVIPPLSLSPVVYLLASLVFPQRTVQVPLPDSATVDSGSSSCGTDDSSPWLVAAFGPGHALRLSFATDGSQYSVATLALQYNLSDSSYFPDANSSGENKHFNKLSSTVQTEFVVKYD